MLLQRKGCRVPYLNGYRQYPKCITQKSIEDSKIEAQTRKKIGVPKPCHRISKIRSNVQFQEIKNSSEDWYFSINYPEEVKIIT